MPFGVRDVLVVLLVGGLGCQREGGKAAVVGGASFCIAAEKADEGCRMVERQRSERQSH